MLVKDLMQADPMVAEVPGTRNDALRLFVKHGVSGVPVVRARTRDLAGVVTRSDVFRRPDEEQLALLMTRDPHVIAPEATLAEAARMFYLHRIHGLPVVDDAKRLVGLLSPTDLLNVTKAPSLTVEEVAKGFVVPIHRDTPLAVAWATMRLTKNNALPVMDDQARLVGIVADSDLFKLNDVEEIIGRNYPGVAADDVDEAALREVAPLLHERRAVELPQKHVRDVMVRDVVTVFQKSSAEEAARKMAKARVNQLPIIDTSDRLVGLVSDLDIMRVWFS